MELSQAESLYNIFKSKAPEAYFIDAKPLVMGSVTHKSVSLFDGIEGDAKKVASLGIKAISIPGDTTGCIVTLYVGNNEFEFVDNPELCEELINRFVKLPEHIITQPLIPA